MPSAAPVVLVHPNLELTAQGVAARLVTRLVEAQSTASPVHLGATGGGLGTAVWPAVAAQPLAGAVDWTGVHVWFSDERFVDAGDAERNDAAVLAVAGALGLPRAHVHRVPGPDGVPDVTAAARAYAAELAAWAAPGEAVAAPWFDVSLLGVGPDGHVASLFPGRPEGRVTTGTTVAVRDSPKPPPQRVSFTRPALGHCRELWFLAAGAAKAEAVGRALGGEDPGRIPAAGLRGADRTLWFLDADLAAALSGGGADLTE